MGIVSRIFNKKNVDIEKAKQETREIVHDDKNKFTGKAINSQSRIDNAIQATDDLQKRFRETVAFRLAIRTGRKI